jgi:hypothetical protein
MQDITEILTTGARIIYEDEAWTVYYKNHLIKSFDNKATALCRSLDTDYLNAEYQERYQKTA